MASETVAMTARVQTMASHTETMAFRDQTMESHAETMESLDQTMASHGETMASNGRTMFLFGTILYIEYSKFHRGLAPIEAEILLLAFFGQQKIVAESGK